MLTPYEILSITRQLASLGFLVETVDPTTGRLTIRVPGLVPTPIVRTRDGGTETAR